MMSGAFGGDIPHWSVFVASGTGPSPSGFKREPPYASPLALSLRGSAQFRWPRAGYMWWGAASEPWTLEGALVRTISSAIFTP